VTASLVGPMTQTDIPLHISSKVIQLYRIQQYALACKESSQFVRDTYLVGAAAEHSRDQSCSELQKAAFSIEQKKAVMF
jgi:hypothetical protein